MNYVFGVMAILLLVIFIFIYFKLIRQPTMGHEDEPKTMQDLLGISDIRYGIVSIGRKRHCKIITVGSINYYLLSPEERVMVDDAFGSLLASLNFPIQIYVQTRLLDLSEAIDELTKNIGQAPKTLQPYGFAMKKYLQDWIGVRSVMLRNPYIIVICENDNYGEARRDLEHRQQLVVEGLANCGLHSRGLSDDEIADMFYAIYNSKTRALIAPLHEALNSSLYVRRKSKGGDDIVAV